MPRRFKSRTLLAALAGLTACDSSQVRPSTSVRESSGVQVSEAAARVWAEGEGWTVRSTPRSVLGGTSDDPAQLLSDVTDVLKLPSGQIAVADNGSMQVKIFSADGSVGVTLGRGGQGPGEFESLRSLMMNDRGDIEVFDPIPMRLSVFTTRVSSFEPLVSPRPKHDSVRNSFRYVQATSSHKRERH